MNIELGHYRRRFVSIGAIFPLAAVFAYLVAIQESWGGWGVLGGLALAIVAVAAGIVLTKLLRWARPISLDDLEADALVSRQLARESGASDFTPRQVERAMRALLASRAVEWQEKHEAEVVFHDRGHTDFDVRIVEHDGEGARIRVCLLQVKARPVPSTFRHLAAVADREDANDAIVVTTYRATQEALADGGSFIRYGLELKVRLLPIDLLPSVFGGTSQTVEVYLDHEPPADSRVPVLIGR